MRGPGTIQELIPLILADYAAHAKGPMAKLTADEFNELNTLIDETVQLEAKAELKRDRIKALLNHAKIDEHITDSGARAKLATYINTEYDEVMAKKVLDDATFAMLFPPRGDNKQISAWAASEPRRGALVAKFKTTKAQASRLTLTPKK